MGLRRNFINDRPVIEHFSSRPRVYLDTWAIEEIETHYKNRFVTALNNKKGTLCLSLVNAVELINYKNLEKKNRFMGLIDAVDSVFIEVDPLKVIKNRHFYDVDLARECEQRMNPLGVFKTTSVMNHMEDEIRRIGPLKVLDLEENLYPQLQEFRSNKDKMKVCKLRWNKRNYPVRGKDPAVRLMAVFNACSDFIVLNKEMKMGDAEWRDTFHAVVPVSCCDFVLIDKRWAKCFIEAGLTYPSVARIFNIRGVEQFISELEGFEAS